jgi:hypothetical protein
LIWMYNNNDLETQNYFFLMAASVGAAIV